VEETRSIVFTILIGNRPYLHEGWKLSNSKDIQTIWFHQLIVFLLQQYFHIFNVNNNSKKFHELQIYWNSYKHLARQWSYVEFTLFCNGFTLKATYDNPNLKAFKNLGYLIYIPLNNQFTALSTNLHLIPYTLPKTFSFMPPYLLDMTFRKFFSLTPIPTWYGDLGEIIIFYVGRSMKSYLDVKIWNLDSTLDITRP
jgi:hypothetical protein